MRKKEYHGRVRHILMALYWAFDATAVARRNLYLARIRDIEDYGELTFAIARFRMSIRDQIKEWQPLPM